MFSALCDCLESASPLVHAICLGLDPVQGKNGNSKPSSISPLECIKPFVKSNQSSLPTTKPAKNYIP